MPGSPLSFSDLRFALRHIYEPSALQKSPLLEMLPAGGGTDAVSSLRLALTQAIESLKPGPYAPTQSPTRRAYEILYYRYVQQCTVDEVADQVGLSRRHLKREHRKALERLALQLAEQYGLAIAARKGNLVAPSGRHQAKKRAVKTNTANWATPYSRDKAAELSAVLPAVLDLVQPMVTRYGVDLRPEDMEGLPSLAVDAVGLRQMLLSVLCVAIRQATGGALTLSAEGRLWQVEVCIQGSSPSAGLTEQDSANLAVAAQLAEECGGGLQTSDGGSPFAATLLLPGAQQVPVLVVDDHADALQLLQRYLTDTRYRLLGAQSAEEALALAMEVSPQAIVLDIMMPEVDGWELVGRLKQHPLTGNIPIIACTIVAQEELALSLGVSAFLRKPVSRHDFLAALDRLVPKAGTQLHSTSGYRPGGQGRSTPRSASA